MKKILVTGGAGYIGSFLTTELVRIGYKVTVLDILSYNTNSLNHLQRFNNFKFLKFDVNDHKKLKKILKNFNFIIPLAALVGAPLCDKFKKKAVKTNFEQIAFICKNLKKNQKLIYLNTNSGYGVGDKNKFCDENSPLNPISLYGKTKVDAENFLLKHKNWISLRLATVFGYSYRMRTDLLVNFFASEALKKKKITIFEPNFRRNFIHVSDVARAIIFFIENFSKFQNNIYNLGLSNANLTKLQLARKVQKKVIGCKIKIINNKKDPDQRNYFVNNKKIEKIGFMPVTTVEEGIDEILNVLKVTKQDTWKNNY
jgi:nucleoside-diphosphate-sugar epimerase